MLINVLFLILLRYPQQSKLIRYQRNWEVVLLSQVLQFSLLSLLLLGSCVVILILYAFFPLYLWFPLAIQSKVEGCGRLKTSEISWHRKGVNTESVWQCKAVVLHLSVIQISSSEHSHICLQIMFTKPSMPYLLMLILWLSLPLVSWPFRWIELLFSVCNIHWWLFVVQSGSDECGHP